MKSLYKKYNKERRLLRAALLVCFTFVVMAVATVLARGEPAQAVGGNSFKAFCWGTCDNFEKLIKNGSEPGVGKYSLYNPNFKYNNYSLYMENGNVIDLRKRCDGKVYDEDDNNAPPYRYWFWVKLNKKATSNITWRTESYIATGKPVDGSNYDARQYENDDKVTSVAISRKSAKAHNGSFYSSRGRVVNGYELDFYVIDLKEWFDKGGTSDDEFYGKLYMQSVIGVYHSGVHNKGPIYTLSAWKGAEGWADPSEFPNHYNQVLQLNAGTHTINFYRVLADDKKPVYGHCEGKKTPANAQLSGFKKDDVCAVKVKDYSAFKLKDIKKYTVGDDKKKEYYLKGLAVYKHGESMANDAKPLHSFYILNDVREEKFLDDGDKETNEYSKFRESGRKKDTMSSQSYTATNTMEFSGTNKKFSKSLVAQFSGNPNMVHNPGYFTGAKTVKGLRNRMQDFWIKSGCEPIDVYLVYEGKEPSEVYVTAQYYDHDDDSGGRGMGQYFKADEEEDVTIGELSDTDHKFSLNNALKMEKDKFGTEGKELPLGNSHTHEYDKDKKVKYTARSVVVEYTNVDGEEAYAYLDGDSCTTTTDEPSVSSTSLDTAIKSASSNKFKNAIWSGKSDEQADLLTAIGKALDKIKITDMDKSKSVNIVVRYYQPELPTMKIGYYSYEDKSGNEQNLFLGADREEDLKEVFRKNGNGSSDGKKFGSYEYASSITVYRNKSDGICYTKEDLEGKGITPSSPGFSSSYETVTAPLSSTFAYSGTVKGYHSQTADSWIGSDGEPKQLKTLRDDVENRLDSELSGNTLTFDTDFKGSVAVGVYGEISDKPGYVAHIHYAMVKGNPSLNPPSECDKDRDSVDWKEKVFKGKAKKMEDGSFAASFKQSLTLDYMGVGVENSDKYGYIKGYTQCTAGSTHVSTGPTKDFTLTTYKAKKTLADGGQGPAANTSGYVTKFTWESGNTDSVEFHVYYVMYTKNPPGGGNHNPETSTSTTKTKWDDVPEGMGTEFGGDGPYYYTKGENCEIKGYTEMQVPASGKGGVNAAGGEGSQVTSVYHVTDDLRTGQDASLIMPDGIMDWGGSREYVPNQLASRMTATAYQSKGEMAKHTQNISKTITFNWTVYYAIPTLYGHSHGSYPDSTDITIKWENIWCSLDKLAVWEAKKTKFLNYAFPNSTDGDKEALDADGDTRTPLQEKWQAGKKDYFVYLDRLVEKWRNYPSLGEDEEECDYGIAYNEYSERVQEEALPALESYVNGLPDTINLGGYGCCRRSTSLAVPDAYEKAQSLADAGVAVYKDKFKTDVLIFVHPDFEDEAAGQVDRILTKDMNAIRTSLNGSRFKDFGDKGYTEMEAFEIEKQRIPQSKMSKEDVFEKTGIKVHQSKLNTKSALEGPEPDSRAAVMYKLTGDVIGGAGSPEEGWFYTDDVNKIVLHTPVSLNVTIEKYAENQVQNTRTFFTESNYEGGPVYNGDMPMPHDGEPLVLGAPFTMKLHYTGDFTNVDYGNPDTEPYVLEEDTAYFNFPYPVYAKDASGSVQYHEKGTEFKLNDVRKCIFYPAYWSEENVYDIDVQVEALNVIGQDAMTGIMERRDRICDCRNTCRDYYRVKFYKRCTVVGILTNLRITDVADYPYLEKLFRTSGYTKSGFAIHSGNTTFNQYKYSSGESATYPVVDGQTLGYLKYGVFKPGYKIRFNVDTIATMEDRNDEIRIEPSYYWIPKKPVTGVFSPAEPVPVKVYYDEMEGTTQNLVEVGSALDLGNVHQLCIGDREHDAALRDLTDTAALQNYEKLEDLTGMITDAWTYYHVTIPGNMRVNEGIKNSELLSWSYNYDWDGDAVRTKLPIPGELEGTTRLNNCLQDWYGEYYLPDKIYVRLADSASDTKFAQDAVAGYDFNEDYWCTDGYLVVNFNITSYKNDTPHLTYNARDKNTEGDKLGYDPGFGDMWEIEDRAATKTDSWLQTFNFNEGDFILYDLEASMSSDYKSGGTH